MEHSNDEYEYDDDEDGDISNESEEDPRVIKELIDLIKKAGKHYNPYFIPIRSHCLNFSFSHKLCQNYC
ncbi:hypothetical protein NQ314_019587 [Rhamnusium bicolor]|uniref:Uncharacterized protein n=1 Tax=Rhamnusium bicolor TaxID=1586634 RepID=A0AAV8WML2_9CUCU|nr:hypothetical protein NQ314_019587 [Rhamnusium bicolor]